MTADRHRVDLNSYLEYFGTLGEDRVAEMEGKVLAAIQRNGDWEILAVEDDYAALDKRLESLGIDDQLVVRDRIPPPQFH